MITPTNYLINVASRVDRLENMKNRFSQQNLKFELIEAITGQDLIDSKVELLTRPNTEANWRSIQKIFGLFLQTDAPYCCVFEDDAFFLADFANLAKNFSALESDDVDILQFGYLTFGGKNDDGHFNFSKLQIARLRKALFSMSLNARHPLFESSLIRLLHLLGTDFFEESRKRDIEKKLKLTEPLLPGFEPGTHAFLISRKIASLMVDFNLPMVLSADLVFMTLSKHLDFRIYRTGKPHVTQDGTFPSINGHATHAFDLSWELFENK